MMLTVTCLDFISFLFLFVGPCFNPVPRVFRCRVTQLRRAGCCGMRLDGSGASGSRHKRQQHMVRRQTAKDPRGGLHGKFIKILSRVIPGLHLTDLNETTATRPKPTLKYAPWTKGAQT